MDTLKTATGRHPRDTDCGTPLALIELAGRGGRLRVVEEIVPAEIVVEFPMSQVASQLTGYARFCLLRSGKYAATPVT